MYVSVIVVYARGDQYWLSAKNTSPMMPKRKHDILPISYMNVLYDVNTKIAHKRFVVFFSLNSDKNKVLQINIHPN